MRKYELFPNPPITESVLEILVKLPNTINIETFKKSHKDLLSERFPESLELREFSAGVKISKEPSLLPPKNTAIGYHFKSTPNNKLVQFRLNGFAFNKLKPYHNWRSFSSEAKELWVLYRKIAKPMKITRISLRYINRIEVPFPFRDFNEYILTNPQIAPKLPQSVSSFFMRLEVPNDDIPAIAIIIQTMEKPTKDKKLPLILDIDVIREFEYNKKNISKIWKDFEELHDFKNDIFFNSITDKTKELFR